MQENDGNVMITTVSGSHAGKKRRLYFHEVPEALRQKTGLTEFEGEQVFCEILGRQPVLAVCGGGHVGAAVVRLGKQIGYRVIALEERPVFAGHVKEAGADEVICDSYERAMEQVEGTADTYFVIVTRGHRYDTQCLKAALGKERAYIGMMGSKRRVALVKEQLLLEGFDKKELELVHAPIGLLIGAETPEEIAVSVAAELIQVKNSTGKSEGYPEELLSYLTGRKEAEKKKVLAVIVERKGSAPRKTGTKMLVLEDGKVEGTIGGGCAEAQIIRESLLMMRTAKNTPELFTVDMTAEEAGEEGMVCGGTMRVYLEPVRCEEYEKLFEG